MREFKLIFIFTGLIIVMKLIPGTLSTEVSSIFLTISTFLFAILNGFFIYRQDNRYQRIRDTIAEFDGNISAIYRSFSVFGKKAQKEAGGIIKAHYQKILDEGKWNYHFTHKSSTITDLNNLLTYTTRNKRYASLKQVTITNMVARLHSLQTARKSMVSLHVERIPLGEWIIIVVLAILTLYAVLLIPTAGYFSILLMKAVFATLIIQIVILLYELDSLRLFEKTLGENSAKDILAIMSGEK